MSLLTYTTAPEDYDYGWARTQADCVATLPNGKVVRLVEHDDQWHMEQQRMRYGSGMHLSIDTDEYERQLGLGFIVATPELQKVHRRRTYEIPYNVSDDNQNLLDTAAAVEAIEGVNTDTHCRNTFSVSIHVIGNDDAFKQACSILDELLKNQQERCGE